MSDLNLDLDKPKIKTGIQRVASKNNKKDLTMRSGVAAEMLVTSYYNEEIKVDDLKLLDYRRMKDNDGQVQMLINATVNTILASGFEIIDDPDFVPTEKKPDSDEKLFIQDNLTKAFWKGGMRQEIDMINRNFMRALEEGFRVYEIVYRLDKDGKFKIDSVEPRASYTGRDGDLKIIVDNNGHYVGFHQKTSFKSNVIDVILVNDSDISKTINVVFGEEYGSNYGRSALKPIYYHYDKAHKGMYLNHIGHELGVVKFRHVKKKGSASPELDNSMSSSMSKVGVESYVMYPEESYELIFEDVSDASVMAVGKEMIEYHTGQMAKAWLAQFIDLGTTNSGSRALGESQQDFFKNGLMSVAKILIERPWNKLIADLIKINFNTDIYPTLKVNPFTDDSAEVLYTAFTELVKGGKITPNITKEILAKSSEKLSFDLSPEDIEAEVEAMEVERQQEKETQAEQAEMALKANIAAKSGKTKLSEVNLADNPSMDIYQTTQGIEEHSVEEPRPALMQRPLYPDEQKVKLLDMTQKLGFMESRAKMSLESKLNAEMNTIVDQFVIASRKGLKSIGKVNIQLAEQATDYSQELLTIALEALEMGKIMSANELKVSVPNSTTADRMAVEAEIDRIIQKQISDLRFRLAEVATNALQSDLPENQTLLLLQQEFVSFMSSIITPTLLALIPKSFNMGRSITFKKYQDKIFAYRYTAILDNRTTAFCRDLDGKVFQVNDPNYYMLTPPNHFGCRSIWTPITKQEAEENNIVVTGKPDELPLFASISSFRDVTDIAQLSEALQVKKQLDEVIATL